MCSSEALPNAEMSSLHITIHKAGWVDQGIDLKARLLPQETSTLVQLYNYKDSDGGSDYLSALQLLIRM